MPRIDPESVDQVRQVADLVELLRGRVELTRRSGRWWGRCPFHDERSPSFTILPDHRNYYCFGCGAKGDAITWMREREGAGSFNEAVEALAERFGIELRYAESSPQEDAARAATQRRTEVLGRARDFYSAYLWKSDEAAPARAYLIARGFSEDLLRSYGVGYAPRAGGLLAARALKQGYQRRDLAEAGLARDRGGSVQDFFTARIMFPIANARGQVQGFGGRTLDPNERAKYVNSPEGRTFQKRRLLFALDRARVSGAKLGWIAVCEGYTDVLALAKAGYDNAVACMGTSLTNEQLRLLARATDEVRLCFDGDRAGQEAVWRSVEAASGVAVRISAVPLPAGRDPGDLAGDETGLAALREVVENPEPMMSYLVRARIDRSGRTAADREQAFGEIATLLARFPEGLEKDEALRIATGRLGLSAATEERLRRASVSGTDSSAPTTRVVATSGLDVDEVRERRWLAMVVSLPDVSAEFVQIISDPGATFDRPEHRRAYELLASGVQVAGWPEDLAGLGVELRALTVQHPPTVDELREATYRLNERTIERRATSARERGDVEEFLEMRRMLGKFRQAIREARRPA